MLEWLRQLYSPDGLTQLLQAGGVILIIAIVFCETGILAGFFLPGDSLLVTAGVLCAMDPTDPHKPPIFDFATLSVLVCVAAIAGDWVNFWLGKLTGNRVWQRPDGRFFKKKHLQEAHEFYARYGGAALALGRFIPIVRTFVPFAAGMSRMRFRGFMAWNILGAIAWVYSMMGLGHWCGRHPALRENLHYLILAIIAISFIPLVFGVVKRMRQGRAAPNGAHSAGKEGQAKISDCGSCRETLVSRPDSEKQKGASP
jgi:membrane-associated protein